MATLNTDIRYIKGVGEARAKSLAKLGITDLRSLLSYFPRAYDDRRAYKKIAGLIPGENACVCAVIAGEPRLSRIRKGLDLIKLRAVDETGALELTYFNQSYLKNTLHTGDAYVFFGRAEGTPSRPQMTNPLFEREGAHQITGCIANALMEKEIPVHMTNFALILNDLAASFENRNEYISRLCRYPLLILDDFGMERGTEYGLEQVFNVIDSRYRSGKPLIVTTNLTLDDLRNPEDTAHSRIYDRLISMCVPVRFTGDNFRQEAAQRKMESMKKLITD